MLFGATENGIKSGEILEPDYSLNGMSGCNVRTGESKDVIAAAHSVAPWILVDVHEMVLIETAKGAVMGTLKAQAEAMAAMKRSFYANIWERGCFLPFFSNVNISSRRMGDL